MDCRGFSQFGFFHVNILCLICVHFVFSDFLCINRLLGCGRALLIESNPITNLWQFRLGNMSQARLDRLMMVGYIPKLQAKTDFCEHYRCGKKTRSPHSLLYETVRHPLELIHSDICGTMLEISLGGSQYFITFVDDCTRKVWAYSLRSKDEALTIFSRW